VSVSEHTPEVLLFRAWRDLIAALYVCPWSRRNDPDLITLSSSQVWDPQILKIFLQLCLVWILYGGLAQTHTVGCELSAKAFNVCTINITGFFQSAVSKMTHTHTHFKGLFYWQPTLVHDLLKVISKWCQTVKYRNWYFWKWTFKQFYLKHLQSFRFSKCILI